MDPLSSAYTVSPAFIMQVLLMDEAGKTPLRQIKGHQAAAMAGTLVSPLHTLRDMTGSQGAYFVFSDLSVRIEGSFRLCFELYEMEGDVVRHRASALSDVFSVYSPKRFPGMMESTPLSKLFAEQGLRIRIRTEAGTKKRGKKSLADEGFGVTIPAKRTKRSDSESQHHFETGRTVFTRINASASVSPQVASLTRSLLTNAATTGTSNPGLLIFHHDPFSVYRNENESMAVDGQRQCYPPKNMFELDGGYYHRQLSNAHSSPINDMKTPHHTLDLSDMAAVALLGSLSGGGIISNPTKQVPPSTVSDVDLSQLLAPTSIGLSQQQHSQSSFATMPAGAGFSMGAPYSNYRVTSAHSTGYQDSQFMAPVTACGTQNAHYPSSFISMAARLHPPLRSSAGSGSGGLVLPQMPQRLYSSQIRTASNSSNSDSSLGLDLVFSQPAQGSILQSAGRQEDVWSGVFA
ncbi:hypothetical protein IWW37_000979 [Coemansia sp. RSA 2050]|nr:hypothetical protein IWW37_000979 [Coemansia sp. RSA 2050]KAJ2736204.1 hypothetical protein IW152_000973 [Coemansia sp. BCRC 34962]